MGRTALLLPVVGFLVAECSGRGNGGDDGVPFGLVTEVAIRNFFFEPMHVTVTQGSTIRWTNHEIIARHTVTSGNPDDSDAGELFDSGNLTSGQTFVRRFDDVGTFVYFCDIHKEDPGMRDATVTVEPADPQPEQRGTPDDELSALRP